MAQTKPKAAQFYGVPGNGTAGQVLISDGNGGMFWGANTEEFTVSWNTPTGQGLTYTQPSPQSSVGVAGSMFPSTTFTATKSGSILSGTATIAGLPTGIVASQSYNNTGIGNILTVTLTGAFPAADYLNTDLTLSGLTLSKTVSWATPTGQSLTYTQPSPQSSIGNPGAAFPSTTFTATKSGEVISGTATIAGLPSGITATQSLSGSGINNVLTVTLTGVFPAADSLNTALTLSGLTVAPPLTVDYLVVAGGGGTDFFSGGAGAGGLRTSFPGSTNGGGSPLESTLSLVAATNYPITIGAGGTGKGYDSPGGTATGSNSEFNGIVSNGGGGGSYQTGPTGGGSGGGAGCGTNPGSYSGGTRSTSPTIQGYNGGNSGPRNGSGYPCGGGGGAGAAGQNYISATQAGNGGDGLTNNITVASGTGPYYAGGGGGAVINNYTAGTGGNGGGGDGINGAQTPNNGQPNTGGGGGGSSNNPTTNVGSNGGSGVVILRYPSAYTISGLSGTTTTLGSDKVTTFTVGTGNIQFN